MPPFRCWRSLSRRRILTSDRPVRERQRLLALYAVLFVVVFLLRFTGPVLLVYAACLARGRWRDRQFSPAAKKAMVLVPTLGIALLVALNFQAIFGRYLAEPLSFVVRGDKIGMMINLLGQAVPDQIVPDFHLGFSQPPIVDLYYSQFGHTAMDAAWTAFGFLISAIAVLGIWVSRHKFLPEILYFLTPLIVLTLMMPSTSRYLMSYQPFIWLFFLEGARRLYQRFAPGRLLGRRTRGIAILTGVAVLLLVAGLRWSRVAGTGAARNYAVSVTSTPEYVSEVAGTFRSVRGFLETLPVQNTLLIGSRGNVGRWTAISGRFYYQPDSALVSVARTKNVYLIVECGTLEFCQSFPEWQNAALDRLCMWGEFNYESVFAVRSKWARAEVFRVRPAA
jgi:hypothetical protein